MCLIVVRRDSICLKIFKLAPCVSSAERGFWALMEVLKVMFGNNRSVTKRYLRITLLSDDFVKFRKLLNQSCRVDYLRVFTVVCVFFCSSAAFVLPPFPLIPPSFPPSLPPSLHQLPEELSVWIAVLLVQPVRLRDAF